MSWAIGHSGANHAGSTTNGSNGSSLALTLPYAVSVGDFITGGVTAAFASGLGTTFAITDNLGNSYTVITEEGNNANGYDTIFYGLVTVSGTPTITVTLGGSSTSGAICMAAVDWTVAANATIVAGSIATAHGSSSTSPSSGAVTFPAAGGNYLLWGVLWTYDETYTVGSGFTSVYIFNQAGGILAEYQANMSYSGSGTPVTGTQTAQSFIANGIAFQEVLPGLTPTIIVTAPPTSRRILLAN